MTVVCGEKKRTDREVIYDIFDGNAVIGTISHKLNTGTWLVENAKKSHWCTGDLFECCRGIFFSQSPGDIVFVDKDGKKFEFPL